MGLNLYLAYKGNTGFSRHASCTLTDHRTCLTLGPSAHVSGAAALRRVPTFPHRALHIPHDKTVLVVQELHSYLCDLRRCQDID